MTKTEDKQHNRNGIIMFIHRLHVHMEVWLIYFGKETIRTRYSCKYPLVVLQKEVRQTDKYITDLEYTSIHIQVYSGF